MRKIFYANVSVIYKLGLFLYLQSKAYVNLYRRRE